MLMKVICYVTVSVYLHCKEIWFSLKQCLKHGIPARRRCVHRTNFSVVVAPSRSAGHRPSTTQLPRSNNPAHITGLFYRLREFSSRDLIILISLSLSSESSRAQYKGAIKFTYPYPGDLGAVKNTVRQDIDQYLTGTPTSCGYGHYGCVTTLGNYFYHLAQLKWTKEVLQLQPFACHTTFSGW